MSKPMNNKPKLLQVNHLPRADMNGETAWKLDGRDEDGLMMMIIALREALHLHLHKAEKLKETRRGNKREGLQRSESKWRVTMSKKVRWSFVKLQFSASCL